MNAGTPTKTTVTVGAEDITYWELPNQEISVSYNDPSSRREWLFWGSFDRDVILGVVAGMLPAIDTCAGVARYFVDYQCKEKGGGAWSVMANYRSKPAYKEYSITPSGGTVKRLQAYQTVRGYSCRGLVPHEDPAAWQISGAIPDFKRAIGVNGNNIDGCDVPTTSHDFSLSYRFTLASLAATYLKTLYQMQGKANDAAFTITWNGQSITFAAGDLLLKTAPTKQTSDGGVDVTFNFSASKGLAGGTIISTGFTVPAVNSTVTVDVNSTLLFTVNQHIYILGIDANGLRYPVGEYEVTVVDAVNHQLTIENLGSTGNAAPTTVIGVNAIISADVDDTDPLVIAGSEPIKKKGWEWLDVYYEESVHPTTQRRTKEAVAVYVHQVVKYGDFSLLGIA